jgi:DivIVA domain-containing protein
MDASQSALDSLRTVEFRETLKGYHRDDVDEYLEKAAVEAEGLQEQLRQSGERLRQAAERISQLETALEQQPAPEPAEPAVADDTLQRTLILAQQFVDQTKADAEAQAAQKISEAEAAARKMTEQAKAEATHIASESEQRLRDEIGRLEESRSKLNYEVETMSRHLDGERSRLRTALSEFLRWIDDNVQSVPAPSDGPAGATPQGGPAAGIAAAGGSGGAAGTPSAGAPAAGTSAPSTTPSSTPAQGTPSADTPGASMPAASVSGTASPREMTQVHSTGTPAGTNASSNLS